MKHGPLYPERVLYPVRLPKHHERISRAVEKVLSKMKAGSLCYCGKFCATHRKLAAMKQANIGDT